MRNNEFKEVSIFFGIVIFLSYIVFWGPLALFDVQTANLVDGTTGPVWALVLFVVGGFVPSLAGIILTAVYEGRKGVRDLLRSSIRFKLGVDIYEFMVLIGAYFSFALILIYKTTGGSFDYSQFWVQLPTLIPLILLGPLSEEYGWRGFALKRLLRIVNPIPASLAVGAVWALWHLPLFYMIGTSQHEFDIPFAGFAATVIIQSLIYTYLYIRSNRSLFSVIIYHWIYTYVLQVIGSGITRTALYNWLEIIPSLLIGAFFILLLRRYNEYRR